MELVLYAGLSCWHLYSCIKNQQKLRKISKILLLPALAFWYWRSGGTILFVVVFIIGHALNFGLNLIGCFVHTLRLQFLEFFGKWYRDGGRKFRPLALEPKYYAVKEEKTE